VSKRRFGLINSGTTRTRDETITADWTFEGDVTLSNAIYIKERAAAQSDIAAFGQLWVKDDTPNTLFFTNDAGTDVQLGAADPDKVYRIGHTYGVISRIKVPSGQKDFIIPFFVSLASGQTAKLVKARHIINDGTSVTCKLQKNGSDITGFTGISVTTTAADTDPSDVTLADDDKLALVVTAVSGTPRNMSFTIFIEYTQ